MLRELYCTEPACDCRRVLLQVHHFRDRGLEERLFAFLEDPNRGLFRGPYIIYG